VSLCPLLSSKLCQAYVNTSQCTICSFGTNTSTAAFFASVHCLSVLQNLTFFGSVSLWPLLSCTGSLLSLSYTYRPLILCHNAHYSVANSDHCPHYLTFYCLLICTTIITAAFYSLSNICQYVTLYRLLVVCKYVHCCLQRSVQSQSVSQTVLRVGSVAVCPLQSSGACPLSDITWLCTPFWFCVTMSTAVFYSLSTVCQNLTMYLILFLWHYIHCCLLHSVHCLSVPHTVPSLICMSLCPLLNSIVSQKSFSTSQRSVLVFLATMSIAVF
jgi:hypothetical protein